MNEIHDSACDRQVRFLTKPTPKGSWVSCQCGASTRWQKGVSE